jgi:uncharacterized protein (TIGR02996 family)
MRTFEYEDDKSHKFWNIELTGNNFTVTFGKVGSKGQTQTKSFADAATARKEHDKLVADKLKKGYSETTPAPVAAPISPLQQSLEAALVENLDDLASHSAYADYLTEQGDPRGELIQVQLALENASIPAAEQNRLQKREAELLAEHGRQWLGELARFLDGDWSGPDKPYHYAFRRGWLDLVRILPFHEAFFDVLAQSPEVRLLRRLEVVYDMRYHPFEFGQFAEPLNAALKEGESEAEDGWEAVEIMPQLLESPHLTNLRAFKLGYSDDHGDEHPRHSTMIALFSDCNADQIIHLLGKCPHLEELYLNTPLAGINDLFELPAFEKIRVLQYYYGSDYSMTGPANAYPLETLASNTSLQNLTTLKLHAGRETTIDIDQMDALLRSAHLPALVHLQVQMTTFGDEGARRVVASGALRKLKILSLAYGNMTDDGARLLAASPDLKHLDQLDVTCNALTDVGVQVLEATGVQIIADNQHDGVENEYLYEVDVE